MAEARIVALYRYPVKGFSPEPLERAAVAAGGTMPFDRAFAIENGASGFDPEAARTFPKVRFLMLMKNERMAEFETRYDETSGCFSIRRGGALEIESSLATEEGRARIEAWLSVNFSDDLRGPPKILSAPGHSFSDKAEKVLHLINLASLRDLATRLGRPLDPLRFRPNIVIDGAPAWAEFDWAGELRLPGIALAPESRTDRCAATNVEPKTGRRDMEIPRALDTLYGHKDFGIYLIAKTNGELAVGDAFAIDGR